MKIRYRKLAFSGRRRRREHGGKCSEGEKWRAGMHKGEGAGPWKFPAGPAQTDAPGAAGPRARRAPRREGRRGRGSEAAETFPLVGAVCVGGTAGRICRR